MNWYVVSMGAQGTHRGVLIGGRILTDCDGAFEGSACVRLDLAPGERPPDPAQVCRACQRMQVGAR